MAVAISALPRTNPLDRLLGTYRSAVVVKRRKGPDSKPASKRARFEAFVRESGLEPAFRSAYPSDCGFSHFSFYYDQVYRGSPPRLDRSAVDVHKADFLRSFFDAGEERGTFALIRERMELDCLEERPLMAYQARFGVERSTQFACAWKAGELASLAGWILYNCRHPHAEQVWLRFESELRFGEASRVTVALAVETGIMRSPREIGELARSPLTVWVLLSIVARSDSSFRSEWIRFFRLMKAELDPDDLAFDFVKLLTLNAYLPFMSDAMRDYLSDNGFVQIEYRDQERRAGGGDGKPHGRLRRGGARQAASSS